MKALKLSIALLIITGTVLIANSIFSQSNNQGYDDPNLDRIPKHLLQQSQNQQSFSPFSINSTIVTGADGYDNFVLGTDFAEPHVAVNPRNPLQYFTAFNTNNTYYTMNGLDWYRNNPTFPGFTMMGDPVVAYDSLGNVYYENMYGDGNNIFGTQIAVSSDNGLNWTYTAGNSGNDKNWIAADQSAGPYSNFVYSTITAGTSCNVFRSTNRGQSFIFAQSLTPHNLPGAMPCVGPNVIGGDVPGGCVYVVTNAGGSFSATYSFFVSTNGGASFTMKSQQNFSGYVGTNVGGRNSVQNMRTRPYPFITADNSYGPYRGRLYLVYATNQPAGDGNKPDLFCRYSTDQGASFSAPVLINDDINPTANHQWHPAIWCDKQTGRLFVKWLDTRNTPTSDSCDVYASYSTNGGVSFVQNQKLTTAKFKIDCSSCGGGGTPRYQGDYDGITSYGRTSMAVWTDFRANSFGSYTAYYPDYAMTINSQKSFLVNNDSTFIKVAVPSVKSYTDYVKFTASVDTLPAAGTLQVSFVNGKDSISSYPDSVTVRIKSIGSVTPGVYGIIITGKGPNGIPVHRRIQNIDVNVATLSIGTNRNGICDFKINNVQYNTRQTISFNIGSSVTIQAMSPKIVGTTKYVYTNWSQGGDTTQTITVTTPGTYTAIYKPQYRLIMNSTIGNTFGGGEYYDSAVTFQFGVNSRIFTTGGSTYRFKGWTGSGNGSYTSPDTLGMDTIISISINNAIAETANWVLHTVGILSIGTEIPNEFKLYQNYPNPFNPVTNINFDVPKAGLVQIRVYDILGKEVEVLADKFLQPGKYKATFNAGKFASGIYFYRINTSSFTDIKRMIVLK